MTNIDALVYGSDGANAIPLSVDASGALNVVGGGGGGSATVVNLAASGNSEGDANGRTIFNVPPPAVGNRTLVKSLYVTAIPDTVGTAGANNQTISLFSFTTVNVSTIFTSKLSLDGTTQNLKFENINLVSGNNQGVSVNITGFQDNYDVYAVLIYEVIPN